MNNTFTCIEYFEYISFKFNVGDKFQIIKYSFYFDLKSGSAFWTLPNKFLSKFINTQQMRDIRIDKILL